MTQSEKNSVSDFLVAANREELEAILGHIFKDWPYRKVKALCRAAVIRCKIDALEGVKQHTIYKGVKNPQMKLVKEHGHQQINATIAELKTEIDVYMEIYLSHQVTM